MINPAELRVGNLLNWMGVMCPVVQVDETGFTVADISQNKMTSNYHCSPDEIIVQWELTEEWLLNFGFEKQGQEMFNYFKEEFCLEVFGISLPKSEWEFRFRSYGNETKIIYVHQLQNLYFALTGTELSPPHTESTI